MKRLFYKYLLRAKYIVNNKFYWKFETAKKVAENQLNNCIVWSMDFKPIYRKPTYLWENHVPRGEGW
jgi:hypothetical protein